MNDSQHASVHAAEDAIWDYEANDPIDQIDAYRLVDDKSTYLAIARPRVVHTPTGDMRLEDGVLTVPDWACRPLPILHCLAHVATSPVFPAHGYEFTSTLLNICDLDLRVALVQAFTDHGVTWTVTKQRSLAMKRFAHYTRSSPAVELVFADPTEVVVAASPALIGDKIVVGQDVYAASRLRYASGA